MKATVCGTKTLFRRFMYMVMRKSMVKKHIRCMPVCSMKNVRTTKSRQDAGFIWKAEAPSIFIVCQNIDGKIPLILKPQICEEINRPLPFFRSVGVCHDDQFVFAGIFGERFQLRLHGFR